MTASCRSALIEIGIAVPARVDDCCLSSRSYNVGVLGQPFGNNAFKPHTGIPFEGSSRAGSYILLADRKCSGLLVSFNADRNTARVLTSRTDTAGAGAPRIPTCSRMIRQISRRLTGEYPRTSALTLTCFPATSMNGNVRRSLLWWWPWMIQPSKSLGASAGSWTSRNRIPSQVRLSRGHSMREPIIVVPGNKRDIPLKKRPVLRFRACVPAIPQVAKEINPVCGGDTIVPVGNQHPVHLRHISVHKRARTIPDNICMTEMEIRDKEDLIRPVDDRGGEFKSRAFSVQRKGLLP